MKIVVDKKCLIQYILIYLLIEYIGGRIIGLLGNDLFYFTSIVLSILSIIKFNLRMTKEYFGFILILGISMFLTYVISEGGLSLGSIFSILSRFLVVFAAIKIDNKHFCIRFFKLVSILCVLSLITFLLTTFYDKNTLYPLLSLMYELKSEKDWLGSTYGILLFAFNYMDPTRNAGIFGEPGEYQMLISTAIYFLLFKNESIGGKRKKIYMFIYVVTLLTIQSTIGFFNLVLIILLILLDQRNKTTSSFRWISIGFTLIFFFYALYFLNNESIFYTKFIDKFISDSGSINFAESTGADRVEAIESFIIVLKNTPEKLLFGIGYDGLVKLVGGFTCSGIINSIIMLGSLSCSIMYGYMLTTLIVKRRSIIEVIMAIFIAITMGFSQPDLLSIMTVLMMSFNAIVHDKEVSNVEIRNFRNLIYNRL